MFKGRRAVLLIALTTLYSGCYHYHMRANGDKVNSSYFRKTLSSSVSAKDTFVVPPAQSGLPGNSGLPSSADCNANGLYEVGITSSWKYAAGTVFSFGKWSRVKVEWLCAKEPPVIGPARPGAARQPAAPVETTPATSRPRNTSVDGFTRRTVH